MLSFRFRATLALLGLTASTLATTAVTLRYENDSGRGGLSYSQGWQIAGASYYSSGNVRLAPALHGLLTFADPVDSALESARWPVSRTQTQEGATVQTKNLEGVSRFAMIGTNGHGVFDVQIDDGAKVRIDLRSGKLAYNQVVYRSPALNPSVKHSIKVRASAPDHAHSGR